MLQPTGRHRGIVRVAFAILLALAIVTIVAGVFYFFDQRERTLVTAAETLEAVADLKVAEVMRWRSERLGDAQTIEDNPVLMQALQRLLMEPNSQPLRDELQRWIESLKAHYDYSVIVLVDTKGVPQLSTPVAAVASGMEEHLVLPEGQAPVVSLSPLIEDSFGVHLELSVPILDAGRLLGSLIMRIDPNKKIFPLIQSWPTASPSAETLLVQREGDTVLFLNELRHRSGTALRLRIPLSSSDVAAVRAIQGEIGIMHAVDYRGVNVLAVARPIPNTSWYLVAKIDRDELLRPVFRRAFLGLVMAMTTIGIAGIALLSAARTRRAEREREVAETKLKDLALRKQYDFLSRYSHDVIFLLNDELRIVEVNEGVAKVYGVTPEELIDAPMEQLCTRQALDRLLHYTQHPWGTEDILYETEHLRRDGSHFPVEMRLRRIEVEQKVFFHCVVRDITDRRRAEDERTRLVDILENTSDFVAMSMVDRSILYMNRAGRQWLGWGEATSLGQKTIADAHPPWAFEIVSQVGIPQAIDSGVWSGETAILNVQGEEIPVSQVIIAHRSSDGTIQFLSTIMRDLTEWKRTELILKQERDFTQRLLQTSPAFFVVIGFDGKTRMMNEALLAALEYSAEEICGFDYLETFVPEEDREGLKGIFQQLAVERRYTVNVNRIKSRSGKILTVEWHGCPVVGLDGQQDAFMGVGIDITERMHVETTLRVLEERHRLALEGGGLGTWDWNILSGEVQFNERWAEILGYTLDEIEPNVETWKRLLHPDDAPRVYAVLEEHLAGRTPRYDTEHRLRHKDGHWVWVLDKGRVIERDLDGRPLRASGTHLDITDRKRTDEELRTRMEELLSWQNVTLGREGRVLELKREVNELLKKQGKPPRYESVES